MHLVGMPRGIKKHATRPDDPTRTMCGRDINGIGKILEDGEPTCGRCKHELARVPGSSW